MLNRSRLLVTLALVAIVLALPMALVAVNSQTALAATTRLEIVPAGGSTTAGQTFTFEVWAYASDNIDETYTGTVLFTSSDIRADFELDYYEFLLADEGKRQFSVTLFTPGPQSIDVEDQDNALSGTAYWTVNYSPPYHLVVEPSSDTITAGQSKMYTANAYDQFDNHLADVTADTDFSMELGAGGSWSGSTYTSQYAGNWTVSGNYDSVETGAITGTASLTVNSATLDHIVIDPAAATVTAGENQPYAVLSFDQFNNPIGNVTALSTFSIESGAGGSWADHVYTSQYAGRWIITANYSAEEGKEDTALLTVNPQSADHIVVSPDDATIIAGGTQAYTAEAFDQFNNSAGDVTSSTNFSVEPGAGGSWAANAYTSQNVGVWTVTGDYSGFSDNTSLTVIASAADHIVISPDTATVTAGGVQPYTAEAFDQFNNSLGDVTSSTIFSVDGSAGGSWTNNIYASQYIGDWTVSGNYLGLTQSASLTVTARSAHRIVITTDTTSVTAGTPLEITVTAFDIYGNIATGYTGTVSLTSSDTGATLPANYTFVATDNGVHIFSVILVTAGSQSITATDTVNGTLTDTETWSVVETASNPPNQPSNVSPANAAIGLGLTPTLQSSAFSDPDSGDTHAASQWQITATQGDYLSPVFDSGMTVSNLTTIAVPPGELTSNAVYYWRVRHQDDHGTWSAWSNQTSFSTSTAHLITTAGGQVQTADGKITAIFPSGAVNVPVMVTIEGVPRSAIYGLPDGFEPADTCFSIEATGDGASVITTLAQPVAITVSYSTGDVTAADGDPEKLVLAYRDEVAGEWKILATTVNTANMTLSVSTTHLSTWAVLVPSASADGGGTPVWIWIVAVIAIILAGGLIVWRSVSIRVVHDDPWRR